MPLKKQAITSNTELQAQYDRLVAGHGIKDDPAQRQVLIALEALETQLSAVRPVSPLARWFRKAIPAAQQNGLYIWGNVGRGKSMLMNLFFEHIPHKKKRRVHFHAFMQEVHARIHQLRQQGVVDPVATLATQLAGETTLLCFDELQATDPADATLLYRLFSGLFAGGVTIVATSNHPPATLYTGGVQRERFTKFIALIEDRMRVMPLSSPADYRHMQLKALQQVYFQPLGAAADSFIAACIDRLCANPVPQKGTLSVQGRITVFALYDNSIGQFTFHDLCESAMGPADYLALARRLDTLILTGIPKLSPEKRNEAKRFVTLIDALYEHKVKLICTADASPNQLYAEGDGAFEFQRTASRLAEMQSAAYLEEGTA